MAHYHHSPQLNGIGRCKGPDRCRFQGDPSVVHFTSIKDAQEHVARLAAEEAPGHLTGVRKGGPGQGRQGASDRNMKRRRKKIVPPVREEKVGGEPVYKFHKDLGFPGNLGLERYLGKKFQLDWTPHARQAAEEEEYGKIHGFSELDTGAWELVEVKVGKNSLRVRRLLFRSPEGADGTSDCFVVEVEPGEGNRLKVITAWKNAAGDHHKSLNVQAYTRPDDDEVKQAFAKRQEPRRLPLQRKPMPGGLIPPGRGLPKIPPR